MLQVGSALGDYTLLTKFAEGGMGEIYLGARLEPTGFAPPVVLKVLRDELSHDSTFVDMIVDEANIAMRLQHRNVVSVLDFGAEANTYYMAMEYVHGVSLERLLAAHAERKVTLDLPVAFHIAMELCSALSYAHSRRDPSGQPLGIVHRDVTPANILLSLHGDVRLTDFGLARASGRNTETMPGVLKGRFGYMAPEMLRYEEIDARADVFSAGVVGYGMIAGRHPADGFSMVEALTVFEENKYAPASHHNPHVPEALDAILSYALDANPATRYQSADELGSALRELVTHWARQWPQMSNGRVRLASMMPTLFPELGEPPIRPAELERLLAAARLREARAVPERPSADWDAADQTMIRAVVGPISLPPVPLPSDAIQMLPVGDGDDEPATLQQIRVVTEEMLRQSVDPSGYDELDLSAIKPSEGPSSGPDSFDLDVAVDLDGDDLETAESASASTQGLAMVQPKLMALCASNVALTDGVSVNQAFDRAIDELVVATGSDRGFVLAPKGDQLDIRSARSASRQPLLPHDRRVANGVIKSVLTEGNIRASLDAGADEWLAGRMSVDGLGARSALCVPITNKGVVLAALYLDDLDTDRQYDDTDRHLATAVASSLALLFENEQLRQRIEQGRMEPTGDLPTGIRQGLVPPKPPVIDGWQIGAYWQFAQSRSGDFHDWVETATSLRVTLAHVTDNEVPPGMFTAQVRSYVRACSTGERSLAEALTLVNGLVCHDSSEQSAVSLCCLDIDRGSGDMTYANAGMVPPLFYRTSHNRLFSLAETSGALGLSPALQIEQKPVRLYLGDIVVMITGGVVDAKGPGFAAFGWDRLQKLVLENRLATAGELVVALERAVNLFVGASALERDLSFVVVKRT